MLSLDFASISLVIDWCLKMLIWIKLNNVSFAGYKHADFLKWRINWTLEKLEYVFLDKIARLL